MIFFLKMIMANDMTTGWIVKVAKNVKHQPHSSNLQKFIPWRGLSWHYKLSDKLSNFSWSFLTSYYLVEERVVIKLQRKKQRKVKETRLMLKAEHGKANEVDLFGRQLFALAAVVAVAKAAAAEVSHQTHNEASGLYIPSPNDGNENCSNLRQ